MAKKAPGRNDPCWCGSGKKYKHCHLPADEKAEADRNQPHVPRPREYWEILRGDPPR
jgi:hypothetical protein